MQQTTLLVWSLAYCRYTECRLQQAASSALLMDLESDTVDFLDTFDGAQQEPSVLPARLPNLLINGSQAGSPAPRGCPAYVHADCPPSCG